MSNIEKEKENKKLGKKRAVLLWVASWPCEQLLANTLWVASSSLQPESIDASPAQRIDQSA